MSERTPEQEVKFLRMVFWSIVGSLCAWTLVACAVISWRNG
jgi:hypothetical protein